MLNESENSGLLSVSNLHGIEETGKRTDIV